MKAVAKSAKKKAATNLSKAKSRVAPDKTYSLTLVDDCHKLILLDGLVTGMSIETGETFAFWREGNDMKIAFPKNAQDKAKIPKDARWGQVK